MIVQQKNLSKARRKSIHQADYKHGLYVVRDRDEAALTPAGRSRLQELRDQFMTEPGRIEYRQDLAAHIALMLEVGFSYIREVAEKGGVVWDTPPVKSMGTYLNTLCRLLDGWPKEQTRNNAELEHIQRVIEEHDKNTK
jgi:hypothetical protein